MVRNYVKKKNPPTYTADDVMAAVGEINSHRLTYKQASDKYKVPKTVLFRTIKGKRVKPLGEGRGRCSYLPKELEDELEAVILARSEWGFPMDKIELFELVENYLKEENISTNFKNNKPGMDWYYRFMRDHPRISLRKPEQIKKSRVEAADPFVVYDFYDKYEKILNDYKLIEYPSLIFNCDESGFPTDPSKSKALVEKGKKTVYRTIGGTGRENISVNACVNASGLKLSPHIIFKGQAVQARWTSPNEYPGTVYSATKKGYMETDTFYHWFKTSFIPAVDGIRASKEHCVNKHALLLFDGHKSHISVKLIRLALDSKIILMKLPSHLTHRMQPLDKSVFGPVKIAWDKLLVQHGKKNIGKSSFHLSKQDFVMYIGQVWNNSITQANVQSGFRETGIFPVDPSKFPVTDFKPDSLERYKNRRVEIPSVLQAGTDDISERTGLIRNEEEREDRPNVVEHEIEQDAQAGLPGQLTHTLPISLTPSRISFSEPSTSSEPTPLSSQLFVEGSTSRSSSVDRHTPMSTAGSSHQTSSSSSSGCSTNGTKKTSLKVRSLADSFLSKMKTMLTVSPNVLPINKERQIRLRHLQYGEVLTSKTVLNRITLEEKKRATTTSKGKSKPKPSATNESSQGEKCKKRKLKTTAKSATADNSSESGMSMEMSDSDDQCVDLETVDSSDDAETRAVVIPSKPDNIEVGNYYAASYNKPNKWYVGRVTRVHNHQPLEYELKFLERRGNVFAWPLRDDFDIVRDGNLFLGPITLSGVTKFNLQPDPKIIQSFWEEFKKQGGPNENLG